MRRPTTALGRLRSEHELVPFCHTGIPAHVTFEFEAPGLTHFRVFGDHRYQIADMRDLVNRALAARFPNTGATMA